MREGAQGQSAPFLRRNAQDCYFAALRTGEGFLYMGPMAHRRLNLAARRQMYAAYGIESERLAVLPVHTLPEIRNMILLTNTVLENASLENAELLQLNRIINRDEREARRELTKFVMKEEEADDDEAYRHSYREEQLVLQAIREGRTADAIRLSESMDRDSGQLSHMDVQHRKNLAIVAITLCSRAAIDAGVSPAAAYRISGHYIQKCDEARDAAHLLHYRNRAIEELTGCVQELLNKPRSAGYVEKARDYVRKHYREKIYLEDVAGALGLSPSYLSRLFKKETGGCLQDFIHEERVYRAANLLLYSELSLSEIAVYVGFPNQRYMGKLFKKVKNMTPKAYRDAFRTPEAGV